MRCARSGQDKASEDFPRHRSRPSGRHCYCKPCHNRQVRESVAKAGGSRKYHLKKKYGLATGEFEALLSEQGFLCPICLRQAAVHVDHSHVSGTVRGLLCLNCNQGIGRFDEDIATLRRAIRYLRKFGAPD